MLKQKITTAMRRSLRLICVTAIGLLVIWFRGDLPPRAALGQSQAGPAVVFMAGDLELTGSVLDFDEFTGAATANSPTYVVGQSGLDHMRHYIGYSYGDPNGGNKAQFLQFNNLVVGKQYTFYVQPSSIAGTGTVSTRQRRAAPLSPRGDARGGSAIPSTRTSDAWKVVFNATAPSATIRLGNYFDASNSGGVSRFIYIDAIYSMIGDLELSGNWQIDTDELTGAAPANSPTYVVGQSGLDHVRSYIGYSYGDPSGGNKAQFLQLTNLTVGKYYTVDVYPSGNYGDGNCYYAEAVSGGTVVAGGCMGWLTIWQFQSITNKWMIVVKAEGQTMTLRIGNHWDESNSGGVSRYLILDAIVVQPFATVSGANCFASVPTDRWKGEYYSNTNLTGSPAMVRDDGNGFLNFDFGSGSPGSACGVNADNFSARWTRTVNFAANVYRFTVTGDDGVRLYVDGQLRIDKWFDQGQTTYTADVYLSAGNHEVKLEYYEHEAGAAALLSWTAVGGASCLANVPADRWRGEYYNNTTLTGSVAMVRDDGAGFLNFDFGSGSPSSACGVNADNFSARWTRTVNFAADNYRFTVTGDDGVRLYIDGQLKIDKWFDQGANTYTADVYLSTGNHEVKLEYYEHEAGAVALLSWTSLSVTAGDLNMALIEPNNQIGSPGEDLLSRNCNWSLPLLALPGRAGLDLGLALSLNSLVYTKAGSVMYFDPDQGNPAPGFRLGFPEIRNAFINTEAGVQSYLLIMPSGRRVEFRQINTNVYEAVDSSYMLLTHDTVNSVFILYTTDGTQCRFEDVTGQGDYKCKQIKDRHGNFITIGYGGMAEISTITDTLGRIVNFYYDGFNHLNSITQIWGGQTHTWATFAYGTQTIQTNFPGLTLNGTANGAQESVLTRVGLADGSVYSFEYNTYAQVKTIRRYAPNNFNPVNFPADYFQRAYTTYGLPDNANDPQTDCPRLTSRLDWASDWNPGPPSVYTADAGHAWGQVKFPDGTIYKEFFATTGWQRGLTTQTENWAGGGKKKWTTLHWTQDNTGVAYRLNPRVTETNVYDEAGNRRRTTVSYTSFGLPSDVSEYDVNATTVLRRTHTDYNLRAVYTSRRIIGLPSAQFLYDGGDNLFSKVDYQYDLNPIPNPYLQHPGPTAQHDTANYGPTFVQGRGNLNVVRRWDVTDQDNQSQASEYETGYNTSGSVIYTSDPLHHRTDVSYDDSFSDEQNDRNTYAYPTKMTDPDTFSSFVQYNYDFGTVTRTQDPKLAVVTRTYDAAGRAERVT